jgi:hypothetical protein
LTTIDTSGMIAVAEPTSSPGGADGRHVDYNRDFWRNVLSSGIALCRGASQRTISVLYVAAAT